MNVSERILNQCRKPSGFLGRTMVRLMNHTHKVAEWGLTYVSIYPDAVVLDVGCGGGKTVNRLAKLAPNGKVYGVDYSEDSVKVATEPNKKLIKAGRVKILHASVVALPFPDNFFDLVTAVETYYFWPDLVANLKEIRRVLKPEGQILLINEAYKHEKFERRNKKFAESGNFKYHSLEEYLRFLNASGYTVVEINVLEDKNWIAAKGKKQH